MFKERVIFMGTPEIASVYLQSLIDSHFNIVAVYTQPPRKKGRGMQVQESSVQKLAQKHKIEVYCPVDLGFSAAQKELQDLHPDIIVVMGYGLLLPKFILQLPRFGCINIHVSLLPRWRGAAPIEHAILNGDKITGLTIFKLVEKLDAGPIIAKDSMAIDPHIDKNDLTTLLNSKGTKLLISTLPDLFNKNVELEIQKEDMATHASKITTEIRKLDFNQDALTVYNRIRAFAPQPSAWFVFNKERIKIIKAKLRKGACEPSTIVNDQFHIGCNNGIICPTIVQREGKKPMKIDEFLRGFDFAVGQKINA